MASAPITSWQVKGGKVKALTSFTFLIYKINANCDCNNEMERSLLLIRKAKTHLDSRLKSKDMSLSTKVCIVKAESWTIKKVEGWRIDTSELWCWRILLRVPWSARGSNQSNLMEINPEYSLEGMGLKLKLLYLSTSCKELTHWKRHWLLKRLKAKIKGGGRGWGC